MATNDDLISRIKQSRIGKAVSNVLSDSAKGYRIAGRAINNSPQRQQFSRGVQNFSNFVNKLEASPVGAPSRFVQGQGKQVANWIQSAGSNLGQAAYQVGYNRQQNLPTFQNTGSDIRKGIVPAVQAVTFPLSGLNPGTYLAQSGLSGAINKATGGSFVEGASQGAATAGLTSAFIRGTNPILNRGLSALPTRLPGQVTSRIAPAVGNVAQGIGLDIASGNKTTPLSVGFDVVTGLAGGKGQFASSGGKNLDALMKKGEALGIKGVSPRVNKVHPEDLDVMREFSDKILRQKGSKKELGELGVAAQRLAEHYFGGDWKYANNKKLAQAFEWAIDLNMNIPRDARGQLPKLGITEDAGQSVMSQLKNQPTKGKQFTSSYNIYNQAKGETIVNPLTGETIPKPTGRQAGFIDFGARVGGDQPKPQQSIEPPAVKSMELESSKKTASKIKTQKQKELTFRGEQPVQGGSKLRVKPDAKVKASPSKVSSNVSITRDNKYAFNINKKKLNLNKEQSKQLDNVVETMRPVLEANKGKTLTKQEIIEAGRKANVLQDTIGREESKKFAESLQASRNFLRSEQAQVGITPKFLEQLEIVSSNAADAGRRLQSFNIGAEDVTIKEKVLSDILKIGADVDEVLKAGKNVDWNDAKQITDFYRKFKPASLADKLQEFRYTNMLSSPNTHIVNSFSNILQTAVLAPIEKAIRGTTSFAESRLTGKEQEYFARQGVDYLKGYWKALPDAVKKFSDTIKGVEGLRKPDIDFIPTSTSKVRQIYTLPLQALEASDQFFRTLVKGGEIESLKREGITGARASKLAEESADYRTFRQAFDPEGKLGQNKVLQVWDKWNVAVNNLRNVPGGKWIVPFLQTPTNILKQGFEYSPLGALTIKGSARPHEQLAKTIIGSSVFAGAYALADSGLTTWDAPTNSTERAEFYAAGLQPYSVKIGDKWVSYSKLGPLSYPIAMASALKWAKDEGAGDDVLKTMGRSMAGTLGFFADQSYVRGIGDIIDAFRGDEFKQARGLSNIPSQLIPYRSFMGWVTRLVDPVYRKTSGGSVPEQIGKSIISQIPGLSQNLEAYQTPFGTDSERQFPLVNAVSPLSVTQERTAEKEYYDARQNIRTQKKEVNKVLEDIENGKDIKIDSNKLLTDQVISLTKKKIEAGLEVTPQELETVYLGKVTSLPKDNRYDKSIRDSKLYAKFGTIEEDENLTETQKQYLYEKIATELNTASAPTKIGSLEVSTRETDNFPFPDFNSSAPGQTLRADLNFSGVGDADIVLHFKTPNGKVISVPQTRESFNGNKQEYGLEMNIPKDSGYGTGEIWATVNGKEVSGTRKKHQILNTQAVNRYASGSTPEEFQANQQQIDKLRSTNPTFSRDINRNITIEDLKTYQVAKDEVPRKTLYVYDQMDSMQSKDELMAFLAQGRRPINGQILISDGVIDNLVSDGVIPYELGKELKKYDLNEDGTQKTTKKTSSKSGSSKKGTTKNDQEIAKIKAYGKYLDAIKNITPASGYPQGKIPTTKINVQGLTFGS